MISDIYIPNILFIQNQSRVTKEIGPLFLASPILNAYLPIIQLLYKAKVRTAPDPSTFAIC